jgi:hypothetical protein
MRVPITDIVEAVSVPLENFLLLGPPIRAIRCPCSTISPSWTRRFSDLDIAARESREELSAGL